MPKTNFDSEYFIFIEQDEPGVFKVIKKSTYEPVAKFDAELNEFHFIDNCPLIYGFTLTDLSRAAKKLQDKFTPNPDE